MKTTVNYFAKRTEGSNASGFTLVELMIVVSILGILGAIVLPAFQNHIQQAKEAAAKDDLRILRNAINHYAAEHNDVPPGFINGSLTMPMLLPLQFENCTTINGDFNGSLSPSGNYKYGPYLNDMPENPFNNKSSFTILNSSTSFPATPPEDTGWIYKPSIKEIRINAQGSDEGSTAYYTY